MRIFKVKNPKAKKIKINCLKRWNSAEVVVKHWRIAQKVFSSYLERLQESVFDKIQGNPHKKKKKFQPGTKILNQIVIRRLIAWPIVFAKGTQIKNSREESFEKVNLIKEQCSWKNKTQAQWINRRLQSSRTTSNANEQQKIIKQLRDQE